MKVTAEAARRFLVSRHLLAPARSVTGGPDGVFEVLRRLGSIQIDPIAVAGRSHDLVLHARVAGYEPAWCVVLYQRREIFETTNKALSLVPMSDMPWFRLGWGRKGPRLHTAILDGNAAVAERVLSRIRQEGPLSVLDFESEPGAARDWFGIPENVARAVLEAYTAMGVLGLARRDGNLRYYDLLDRLLPATVLARQVPPPEQLRHKLLSRYRAHGLLGLGGPCGMFDRIAPPPERHALQKELVDLGALVPVDVGGVRGRRFVVASEVGTLQASPEPESSVAFIAPFDSLLWDPLCSRNCSASSTCGKASSRRRSAVGVGTCCPSPSAPASWAGPNRGSIATVPASSAQRLVGGRLRTRPRRRLRRRDARRAAGVPAFRRRRAPGVGTSPGSRAATLPHPPLTPEPPSGSFQRREVLEAARAPLLGGVDQGDQALDS